MLHRNDFNRMIADCKKGLIDLILVKSVSRFARNTVDCLSTVEMLQGLHHPVRVIFEADNIDTAKDDARRENTVEWICSGSTLLYI